MVLQELIVITDIVLLNKFIFYNDLHFMTVNIFKTKNCIYI